MIPGLKGLVGHAQAASAQAQWEWHLASDIGTDGTTHTHTGHSCTNQGMITIASNDGASHTVSGVTWGGNAMTQADQYNRVGGSDPTSAIFVIDGDQTGDIVITWSAAQQRSRVNSFSLNVTSLTPLDNGGNGANSGSFTNAAITLDTAGSFSVYVISNDNPATAIAFTSPTDQVDDASLDAACRCGTAIYEGIHVTVAGTCHSAQYGISGACFE